MIWASTFAPSEPGGLDDVVSGRAELYDAQGIVMVPNAVSLTDAMDRIRGHAYTENQSLIDVARDIVAGRLTLATDPTQPPT